MRPTPVLTGIKTFQPNPCFRAFPSDRQIEASRRHTYSVPRGDGIFTELVIRKVEDIRDGPQQRPEAHILVIRVGDTIAVLRDANVELPPRADVVQAGRAAARRL